jgi:pyruvate,water dikinase
LYVVKLEDASNPEEFGQKAATLADMLKSALPVPKGFVITPRALDLFISENGLGDKIRSVSETKDNGLSGLQAIEKNTRELFSNALIPDEVKKAVLAAYEELSLAEEVRRADAIAIDLIRVGRDHEKVAVRSSVIREPVNSFAGVAGAFLNVSGEDELWRSIKLCWASIFYPHALLYSEKRGIEGLPRMSIVVQKMVDSEKSGSVLTKFGTDKVLVEASWGLGNSVSAGLVTPDEYLLDKNGSLIEKNISKKMCMFVRNPMSGKTEKEHVPGNKMDSQVLTDAELKKLYELSEKAEGPESGQRVVDWCIGRNRAFILDAKQGNYDISKVEDQPGDMLVTGRCSSPGTAAGKVALFTDVDKNGFDSTSLVVSDDPSITVLLSFPDIGGYISNGGGRLCNFSILARELHVPAITATQNAMSILHEGDDVKLLAEHGKVVSVPPETEVPPKPEEGVPEFPLPIEPFEPSETGEVAAVDQTRPLSGTKVFARILPDRIEKIDGVDGFILFNPAVEEGPIQSVGVDVENIRALGEGQTWLKTTSVNDFQNTVDFAKRLDETGFSGIGLLIPVTRSVNDVDRWRYQTPASARLGIEIKTPAMAMAAGSILREGIRMVNIELKSLVQLSMGLSKPDHEIHSTVLNLIGDVAKQCRQIRAKCCVSIEPEHMTDENIEALVRLGVDVICIEPGMIGDLKDMISRAEKRVLLESGIGKGDSEEPESQPYQPEPDTVPSEPAESDEPKESDDFSHAFSFS